jgi:hypothetical protein
VIGLLFIHDGGFDAKCTFSIDEVWFHLSGYISVKSFEIIVYRSDPYTAEDLKGSMLSFRRMPLCECKHLWSFQECVLDIGTQFQHLLFILLSHIYLYMCAQGSL